MVFLKGAMHEALEEHWRRRAVFRYGFDGMRVGSLMESNGKDFQRTGTHDAEPRWVASVGQSATQDGQRFRIASHIAARVNEIEQCCALMLGNGREPRGVVALFWQKVEVVQLSG